MTSAHDPEGTKSDGGFRRILVASDLTAYSDRAFDRAIMLAEENCAAVCFVHAVEPNRLPDSYARKGIREAQALLEQEVRDSGIDKRLDVSVKVVSGEADKVVVDEAQAIGADLIVMGLSHDATLTGMVRGTTIDKVVRHACCPVLVVKTRARRTYADIAAAVDLAEPSRRALDFALRLVPNGRFTILHADESAQIDAGAASTHSPAGLERSHQIEDMVVARFAALGRAAAPDSTKAPAVIVKRGRAVNVLQEQVTRLHPDLVVLGTHGRTGFSNLFLGSVAETLLTILPHDVIVTRA